jgi:hypothetical protein
MATGSGVSEQRMSFTPAMAAAGIAFHLMDENLALVVEQESIQRTQSRLEGEKFCPTIKRELWETMDNRERLDWLMARSKTVIIMLPDGAVRLEKKRSWL